MFPTKKRSCADFQRVLAPNDAAWSSFYKSSFAANSSTSPDQLNALLSYHVAQGAHSQYTITETPQFLTTQLNNSTYTNVTTGQVVEVVLNGTNGQFTSAVNQVSTIVGPPYDILYANGVVHILDEVLVRIVLGFRRKPQLIFDGTDSTFGDF